MEQTVSIIILRMIPPLSRQCNSAALRPATSFAIPTVGSFLKSPSEHTFLPHALHLTCSSAPFQPVAAILGIPKTQIFANRLLFDPDTGKYAGFDDTEPTSRAGGKATAIETIKAVCSHAPCSCVFAS